jgi:hypothetical protein
MMESKASALEPLPKLKLWIPKSLLNYRFSNPAHNPYDHAI